MEVKEIREKNLWERFFVDCAEKTFLQSWNWGRFREAMGEKIWRFGVFEKEELISVALAVMVRAKRGRFLLVPHGPVVKEDILDNPVILGAILRALLAKLKDIAEKEDASFIRINPIWKRNAKNAKLFHELGFRNAPLSMHPEASWKLDITPSEEELLKNMRRTTRYLIKKCSLDPRIKVVQSYDPRYLEMFSSMHKKVSERQHFVPFSFEYLKNEFDAFAQDDEVSLFLGVYQKEIVAIAFVVFWSGIAFYHHAASLPQYSKFSIPYLVQWEAIKEAKQRGCKLYDFWGYVNPKEQPQHPWAGPTLFKMGFGGTPYEYVKTQDLPLSWLYWPTFFFEKLRRFKRHL